MYRDCDILQALADEGTFRAAANALGVTQPYLSQRIKKLEERCHGALVDRLAKPLALTPLGAYFLESRRRIAAIEAETAQYCADYAGLKAGRLRIASNSDRTSAMLVPLIAEFSQAHPQIDIDLSLELQLEDIPEVLAKGEADAGVLFESLRTPELNAYPLFRERYLFVVPDDERFRAFGAPFSAEGRYPKLGELAPETLEPLRTLPFLQTWKHHERTAVLSRAVGFPLRELSFSVRRIGTQLAFAASGLCATVCQETLAAPYAAKSRCRFASLEDVLPVQTVVIAWRERGYQSLASKAFCRLALERLGRLGGGV